MTMASFQNFIVCVIFIIVVFLIVRDPSLQERFANNNNGWNNGNIMNNTVNDKSESKLLLPKISLTSDNKLGMNNNNVNSTEISQVPDRATNRVAIVSMMRRPKDIDEWLEYHRSIGIIRFYIRLEDSEELEEYLIGQNDITLEPGKSTGKDEYKEIQTRQCTMVDNALKKAREDGMDWLIHIDSDELLDGDIDELAKLSEKVRTIVMNNKEAVYKDIPRENDMCFNAARFKDCTDSSTGCVSYVNGKAGGRVGPDVSCFGPHRFRSNRTDAEEKTINMTVLHFESCDFNTYKQKFKQIAKDPKSDIPFPYYNESVAAAQKGDDSELENVFRRYRVA